MISHPKKEIQISVIHSSSNTHSPVSLTVSPSLLLIHSLKLSIFHLSLISHLWQSHQLLHPKVTEHTQYVPPLLHGVMESKIKEIFKFHLSNSQKKTYILRNQVKVTSKYPNEFVRLQSFKAETLTLFLSFFLSQISEELE